MARRRAYGTLALAALVLTAGCSQESVPRADDPEPRESPTAERPAVSTETTAEPRFRVRAAMRDVRRLSVDIGPRLATGPGYRRAADLVARRFAELGYDVSRQRFRVPAGDSWGTPVGAGRSTNVIAEPPGFDREQPHLLVGAHLDTVAVAPGAEDNASGVAVMLELARMASLDSPRRPVVFVAFGAEEPRGPGEAMHHFGSRHYVRRILPDPTRELVGMASLDRVGVGRSVPVCTGGLSPETIQRRVLRLSERFGIRAFRCENRTSDHWQFEQEGFAVVRFGSMPYEAYHTAADLPRVVNRAQLSRTGRLAWAWLRDLP